MSEPSFREFNRALAEEIDGQSAAKVRDALLRAVGRRMARMVPLAPVTSIEALAMEMNDALANIGWGQMTLTLLQTERCLEINHRGLPRLGACGDPPGTWLAAVLEGLYEAWMCQQPGADPALRAQMQGTPSSSVVTLRYARG